ncbi:PREDICTED: periostin-like [Priapulus caudatus]|uniref:Periostin-like n=1 Tax=Priapulus caudatus TaxID=37621 RepID=A0ABM1FC32_PRICU|nr:PREDICTED: periostin-like [Priapulus caudatus]
MSICPHLLAALSIVGLLERRGEEEVVQVIRNARLEEEINDLRNVTFFVPSDEAFQGLSPADYERLRDRKSLVEVIRGHVTTESLSVGEMSNNQLLPVVDSDKKLLINKYKQCWFDDNAVTTVQCAKVVQSDLMTCGAAVHIIDKVLMPPTDGTVLDMLRSNSSFSIILELMEEAGLLDHLSSDTGFTFFAPTNDAITEQLPHLRKDSFLMQQVLALHILPEHLCCAGVFNNLWTCGSGVQHATVGGPRLRVYRTLGDAGRVVVNEIVRVTQCDRVASNGVVHVVDGLITRL